MRNGNDFTPTDITPEDEAIKYCQFAGQVLALNDFLFRELQMARHTLAQVKMENNQLKVENNSKALENVTLSTALWESNNSNKQLTEQIAEPKIRGDESQKIADSQPGNVTQTTYDPHKRGPKVGSKHTRAKRHKPDQDQPALRSNEMKTHGQTIDLDPDQDANMNNASRGNPPLDLLAGKSLGTAVASTVALTYFWKPLDEDTVIDQIDEYNLHSGMKG